MASEVTETHLNPLKLLKTLDKILPDNAILVADGGDFVGSAAYILRYPNSNFEKGILILKYALFTS
jgi:thiamine pyrophosphate-dependent acetolactate synthase large subunit-like protein